MNMNLIDRINSVLSYYTFGIFGIILMIFCSVCSKKMSIGLLYNIYQSIFISVILTCISAIYSFLFNVIMKLSFDLSFLKNALTNFDIFLNRTPIFFTFTLTGFIVFSLATYLSIFALLGKKSYLPFVSEVISANTGVK